MFAYKSTPQCNGHVLEIGIPPRGWLAFWSGYGVRTGFIMCIAGLSWQVCTLWPLTKAVEVIRAFCFDSMFIVLACLTVRRYRVHPVRILSVSQTCKHIALWRR